LKGNVRKLSWTLIGNLIYAATQFLTLSMIAKLGGPTEVGIFTFTLAITSPIYLFFNVKLRSVILTDQSNENNLDDYFQLRNLTNLFALILIIVVSILLKLELYIFTSVILLGIAKMFEMRMDVNYGVYQKKDRFDLVGKSTILRGLINFLLAFIFYYLTKNIISIMLAFIITNLLIYILFDMKNMNKITFNITQTKPSIHRLVKLFLLALPLGVSTVIGSLNANIPRYIVENKLGLYELGIFSGMTYLLVVGNTFLSSISPIVTPKLAKLGQEKDYNSFIKLLLKLIGIGSAISMIMIFVFGVFGKEIITLIYTEDYAEYHNVLMIIISGIVFLYTSVFLGTAITALRKFKVQPRIHLVSLIAITLTALLLIENYGLVGMAWSLFVGYVITSLGYLISIVLVLREFRKGIGERS